MFRVVYCLILHFTVIFVCLLTYIIFLHTFFFPRILLESLTGTLFVGRKYKKGNFFSCSFVYLYLLIIIIFIFSCIRNGKKKCFDIYIQTHIQIPTTHFPFSSLNPVFINIIYTGTLYVTLLS